jgi:hypothetical protein
MLGQALSYAIRKVDFQLSHAAQTEDRAVVEELAPDLDYQQVVKLVSVYSYSSASVRNADKDGNATTIPQD